MIERQGDWMQTFTGRKFWPFDPRPEDVCIEDIAHALSLVCRFGGHTKSHYSVAQHSVLVMNLAKREFKASPEVQLHALLHDAAEAYIGDMVNPIKKEMTSFRHLDIGVTACIYERFGLTPHSDSHSVVDKCDKILVSTEAKSPLILAQPPIDDWHLKIAEPLDGELTPWPADKAETVFLAEFRELYKGE